MKGISGYGRYLNKALSSGEYFFASENEVDGYKTKHTRKELEKSGFGWVFDCPGVEVKEVKEWFQNLEHGIRLTKKNILLMKLILIVGNLNPLEMVSRSYAGGKIELMLSTNTKDKTEKKSLKGIFFGLITLKLLYVLDNTATMTMPVKMF